MKLVEIVWDDITSHNGWNDGVPFDCCRFTTVGYLIEKNKDVVAISDTKETVGNLTVFPKGCIVKITEL